MIMRDVDLFYWLEKTGAVTPYFDRKIRHEDEKPVISYGLSHAGVDIRCGNVVRMVKPLTWFERLIGRYRVIDPKNIDERDWLTITFEDYFDIPPRTGVLVSSMERFKIPENILGHCIGKSTYARCFITPLVTPLEPGWGLKEPEGATLVIEILNANEHAVRIYAGEGIAQILFEELFGPVAIPYCGVYNQQGAIPVLAKVQKNSHLGLTNSKN